MLSTQELNFLSKAIDNNNNDGISKLEYQNVDDEKKDIIDKLEISKTKKINLIKSLKDYRYVEDLQEIVEGRYLRWLIEKDNDIKLSNGGILIEVKIEDEIYLLLKNNRNLIFQIKLQDNVIFQKLTDQEKIILFAKSLI